MRGFCKPLPGGAGFASLLSLHGGWRSRSGFPTTLTLSSHVGGMDALPDIILPRCGQWRLAEM
jgi:hypothetical protein